MRDEYKGGNSLFIWARGFDEPWRLLLGPEEGAGGICARIFNIKGHLKDWVSATERNPFNLLQYKGENLYLKAKLVAGTSQ